MKLLSNSKLQGVSSSNPKMQPVVAPKCLPINSTAFERFANSPIVPRYLASVLTALRTSRVRRELSAGHGRLRSRAGTTATGELAGVVGGCVLVAVGSADAKSRGGRVKNHRYRLPGVDALMCSKTLVHGFTVPTLGGMILAGYDPPHPSGAGFSGRVNGSCHAERQSRPAPPLTPASRQSAPPLPIPQARTNSIRRRQSRTWATFTITVTPFSGDNFVAPVELVGFPRCKAQRHVGRGRCLPATMATSGVAAQRIITAVITATAQLLEDPDQRQLLASRLGRIAFQH
jgi:hypothetical protein